MKTVNVAVQSFDASSGNGVVRLPDGNALGFNIKSIRLNGLEAGDLQHGLEALGKIDEKGALQGLQAV